MASISELRAQRARYVNALEKIRPLVDKLSKCISAVDSIPPIQKRAYEQEDSTLEAKHIEKIREKLNDEYTNLTGNVIPTTQNIISDYDSRIAQAEAEAAAAAARRRQAAAAAARGMSNNNSGGRVLKKRRYYPWEDGYDPTDSENYYYYYE